MKRSLNHSGDEVKDQERERRERERERERGRVREKGGNRE